MNETIAKIVNMLFDDIQETEETRALREEIGENCQERYQDLLDSGMTQDGAIHAVLESLNGMEDVLKDYPRKQTAFTGCSGYLFDPAAVKRLDARLTSSDVQISPTHGDKIHVFCPDTDDRLRAVMQDGVLTVEPDRAASQGGGLLDRLFGALGDVPSTVCIELPASLPLDLRVTTTTGDLSVSDLSLKSVQIRTTTGDIHCADLVLSDTARLESTSGDIQLRGSCPGVTAATISGDLHMEGVGPHVDVKTTSGDITLEPARLDRLNVSSKTVSGDQRILLPEGISIGVSCHTVSGDVHQMVPCQPGSLYQLNISSVSGDITIR